MKNFLHKINEKHCMQPIWQTSRRGNAKRILLFNPHRCICITRKSFYGINIAIFYFFQNVTFLYFNILKYVISINVTYEYLMFGISMKQTIMEM
jgi:hypothetical protein